MSQRWRGVSHFWMCCTRKEYGKLKVQIYWNSTHTNQNLNFSSHHQLNHKLGVICTLYNHCDNIVTEEANATKEIAHGNHALGACSYPSWSFKRVREQWHQWELKRTWRRTRRPVQLRALRPDSLCFISGVFQRPWVWSSIAIGWRHRGNPTTVFKRILVHPKEKPTSQGKCVCSVPGPM